MPRIRSTQVVSQTQVTHKVMLPLFVSSQATGAPNAPTDDASEVNKVYKKIAFSQYARLLACS